MLPLDRSFHDLLRRSMPDAPLRELIELENLSALHFHLVQERDICACHQQGGSLDIPEQQISRLDQEISASAKLAAARIAHQKKGLNAIFTRHATRRRFAALTSGAFGLSLNPAHLRRAMIAGITHEWVRLKSDVSSVISKSLVAIKNISVAGLFALIIALALLIFSAVSYHSAATATETQKSFHPGEAASKQNTITGKQHP